MNEVLSNIVQTSRLIHMQFLLRPNNQLWIEPLWPFFEILNIMNEQCNLNMDRN